MAARRSAREDSALLSGLATLSDEERAAFRAAYDGRAETIRHLAVRYRAPRNAIIAWAHALGCTNTIRPGKSAADDPMPSFATIIGLDDPDDLAGLPIVRHFSGPDRPYLGRILASGDTSAASEAPRRAERQERAEEGAMNEMGADVAGSPVVREGGQGGAPSRLPIRVRARPEDTAGSARKYCPGHRYELPVTAFGPDAAKADGLAAYCRECHRARGRGEAPEAALARVRTEAERTKKCAICHQEKPLSAFRLYRANPDGHAKTCRACKQGKDADTSSPALGAAAPAVTTSLATAPVSATASWALADPSARWWTMLRSSLESLPVDTGGSMPAWSVRERVRYLMLLRGIVDFLIDATPAS